MEGKSMNNLKNILEFDFFFFLTRRTLQISREKMVCSLNIIGEPSMEKNYVYTSYLIE